LFRETRKEFQPSADVERVRTAFGRLANAIKKHYDYEDRIYFPSLSSIQPEYKSELQELSLAHERFRSRILSIQMLLGNRDNLEEASRCFETFCKLFEAHEAEENEFFHVLDIEKSLF